MARLEYGHSVSNSCADFMAFLEFHLLPAFGASFAKYRLYVSFKSTLSDELASIWQKTPETGASEN